MIKLHLDFETYSDKNLKTVGAIRYSESPNARILLVGYAIDDGEVKVWDPADEIQPLDLWIALEDKNVLIYAHNANFERAIIENVAYRQLNWPRIDVSRYRCTAAMAAALALPRGLAAVATALKLPVEKDTTGMALIRIFCIPNKQGERTLPEEKPEKWQAFKEYCIIDVEVARAVDNKLIKLPLIDFEQKVWELDSDINLRGLPIDIELITAAQKLVDEHTAIECKRCREITGGINPTQTDKLKAWIEGHGVELEDLTKPTLQSLTNLPEIVTEVINIRLSIGRASVKKLTAFIKTESEDHRIRGTMMYHGATTGRFSARLVQPHNLFRPTIDNPYQIAEMILLGSLSDLEFMYGDPLEAIASCLRHMICSKEGYVLNVADYSAIEARVIAWIAGQENVLEIFRGHGKIYEHAAAGIFGVHIDEVTDFQRRIGKVAILALGYGGAVGAFQNMAGTYGVVVEDEFAQKVTDEWRADNPNIVQLWKDIESACKRAIRTGKLQTVGKIKICMYGIFLLIRLPSRRRLAYPYPKIEKVTITVRENTWDAQQITFYGQIPQSQKWGRISTYGGKLVENIVQAIARDLMVYAMINVEGRGYPLVGTVHDEILSETLDNLGSIGEFSNIICELPDWAEGLPLTAEGYRQRRYKK